MTPFGTGFRLFGTVYAWRGVYRERCILCAWRFVLSVESNSGPDSFKLWNIGTERYRRSGFAILVGCEEHDTHFFRLVGDCT